MARKTADVRQIITLQCGDCRERNYTTANTRSSPPKKNPATMANMMTTTVNRAVSSRLGQADFRSS